MAWPASTKRLDDALESVDREALSIKQLVQGRRDQSAAGPVRRKDILALMRSLNNAVIVWNAAAAVPGIIQFARDAKQDQALDVVGEFNTMVSAAEVLRDWIFANLPTHNPSQAVLTTTVDTLGNTTELMFTTAELATFRTNADAFIATIG